MGTDPAGRDICMLQHRQMYVAVPLVILRKQSRLDPMPWTGDGTAVDAKGGRGHDDGEAVGISQSRTEPDKWMSGSS